MVRAKFKVDEVRKSQVTGSVVLSPVITGSEENKNFFKYTPGGSIQLNVVSHTTLDLFVPGEEYYVDFTPARS